MALRAKLSLVKILNTSGSRRGFALQAQNVMNVFDRQTKLKQKNRAYSLPDSDVYDYLKNEIGSRLSDRIFDINRKFSKVVDLGCGKGYVSRNIIADSVESVVMCDSSELVLKQAQVPEDGVKVEKMVVDEENLPFEPGSVDLVISSLALHWVNNLPGTFAQVLKCLKNDGAFMGALFGGDTLFELRCSLQMAELERSGGLSPHISPFIDVSDLGGLLTHTGFTMLTLDSDEMIINYPSMFEVMWDLKGMGENNCAWKRALHLRRDVMMAASAIYQNMYGSSELVPATFQIIYFLAWKPDPSQPKPLERGSASHSFKDFDSVVSDIAKARKK